MVSDAETVELLSTDCYRFDVLLRRRCAVGLDGYVTVGVELGVEMQCHLVECGCGECVRRVTGVVGI